MKKEYIKPFVEIIDFQLKDTIMDDIGKLPTVSGTVGGDISEEDGWE